MMHQKINLKDNNLYLFNSTNKYQYTLSHSSHSFFFIDFAFIFEFFYVNNTHFKNNSQNSPKCGVFWEFFFKMWLFM